MQCRAVQGIVSNHGGHREVQSVDPIARLEVGHGGLGAAARGEGRERQPGLAGQPGGGGG